MVTVEDLINLPYTADLTRSGIVYASRSLSHTYDRMGGSRFERLRRIVAGIAVELAFRRYLQAREVPFDILGTTPFTAPDRYDLAIAGRRCDLKSFLILNKRRIRSIRETPETLLAAPALVPADQMTGGHLRYEDLYIFAFLSGLVTPDLEELARAVAAGQPHHLVHPMPRSWAQPASWASLGRLVMKSELDTPLTVELGGQNGQREFQVEALELAPRQRTRLEKDYFTLAYVHPSELPAGRLGVHSPRLAETYLVGPEEWGNIWVYGLEIILAGYVRWGDFRRNARRLPPGAQVLQYRKTRVENMAVPIRDLQPIEDLIIRGKNWSRWQGR